MDTGFSTGYCSLVGRFLVNTCSYNGCMFDISDFYVRIFVGLCTMLCMPNPRITNL